MKKEIIINASSSETRIGILEDGILVGLYVERPENERMVGDIYMGKVENVVEAIQAAFVDIGLEQNGFLPFADVGKEYSGLSESVNHLETEEKQKSKFQKRKDKVRLKSGQTILVQVTKEPIGSKGARLTSAISLPGRFLVLVPRDKTIGVSRKIVDVKERRRLRLLAKSIQPDGFGLIIRTVAVGKDVYVLRSDLENLLKIWRRIEDKIKSGPSQKLLYKDMGMTSSVIRDLFSPDIDHLVVDSRKLYGEIKGYLKEVAPSLLPKLDLYKKHTPIFDEFKIEDAIENSLSRKIWMKSGGHIIFDQTEALVVIDVNSGRSVGEKDHERNALKTDLEAARLIAHQLRLRDIGGIIVIDFIDLILDKNRKKVVAELKKELKKDRAAFDVLPMSNFGLVELTRERVRPSLLFQYSESCPRCAGLGRITSKSAIVTKIERKIQQMKCSSGARRFVLKVNPEMASYMSEGLKSRVRRLMMKFFITIKVVSDPGMKDDNFILHSLKEEKDEDAISP